jgi:hypothetical protein
MVSLLFAFQYLSDKPDEGIKSNNGRFKSTPIQKTILQVVQRDYDTDSDV